VLEYSPVSNISKSICNTGHVFSTVTSAFCRKNDTARLFTFDELVTDVYSFILPKVSIKYGMNANVILFGHSMGGVTVTSVGVKADPLALEAFGQIKGFILSAPSLKPYVPGGAVNKLLASMVSVLATIPRVKNIVKSTELNVEHLTHDKAEI